MAQNSNLPCSGYTFVEASPSQKQEDFIASINHCLRYETDDYIRIYYAFDSDITAHPDPSVNFSVGAYTQLVEFRGSGPDTDLSVNGSGVGTLNTGSFTDYTYSIPGTGNSLSIRIVMQTNSGDEEIEIDHVRLQGTAPLPIELTTFEIVPLKSNEAQLYWQTTAELNSDYFAIERSQNGTQWEIIGHVPGAGNSQNPLNYYFVDHQPYTGLSYYRLAQTDLDKSIVYSDIKSLLIADLNERRINIYPNPTFDKKITIKSTFSDNLKDITVYNLLGQEVTPYVRIENTGSKEVLINFSTLPSGVYFITNPAITEKIYLSEFP